MTAANLFELATRKKLRFDSPKGELSVEQVWDLPLTSKTGTDLDTVGKTVLRALKDIDEESLVATKANPAKPMLEVKLEIVKHIIGVKQAEDAAKAKKADQALRRAKLVEALGAQQDAALKTMSQADILAELAKIDEE